MAYNPSQSADLRIFGSNNSFLYQGGYYYESSSPYRRILTMPPQGSFAGTDYVPNVCLDFTNGQIGLGSSQMAAAATVLAQYGANAHVYLPSLNTNYSDSAGTTAAVVDGSVGQVADAAGGGINATQATAGFKPTLRRGAVNLLTYSRDYNNGAWLKQACSVTGSQSDPFGGSTAYKVIPDGTSSAGHRLKGSISATGPCTFASLVKAAGYNYAYITDAPDSNIHFDLTIGATSSAGASWTNPFCVAIGGGWYLCGGTSSATLVNVYVGVDNVWQANGNTGVTFAGDTTSGIYIGDSGVFQGTITGSQILAAGGIPATTSAVTSSSTGNYHLDYTAASTQRLDLGSQLWQINEDHCVVAGARCDSKAAYNVVINPSGVTGNNNSGGTLIFEQTTGKVFANWSDGTNTTNLISAADCTGTEIVVSCRAVGTTRIARKNGVQFGTETKTINSITSTSGRIGANTQAAGSPLQGAIYPIIAIKGTVSDADLLTLERWVGTMTGTGVTI